MKTIINDETLFHYQKSKTDFRKFFVLGDRSKLTKSKIIDVLTGKLSHTSSGIWGTIGWKNNTPFQVNGQIEFSKNGQTGGSLGITLEEIKSIYQTTDGLNGNGEKTSVRERYINLSAIDFELPKRFKLDELPVLRLTIFLDKDEGALSFYEHADGTKHNNEKAFPHYILPKQTDKNYSFNRTKLSYDIPVIPTDTLIETAIKGVYRLRKSKRKRDFVVKLLTFKRPGKNPDDVIKLAISKINASSLKDASYELIYDYVGNKKYQLSKFNPQKQFKNKSLKKQYAGGFEEISGNNSIDVNKRTLLLLHGTFSSTMGSFSNLVKRRKDYQNTSFLQEIMNQGYEQVLSFDRPTMSANVYQNLDYFFTQFQGIKMKYPLSIITTSQGGVVAEAMSSHEQTKKHFNVEKIIMFSAANGCGYFEVADKIGLMLSVLKRISSPGFTKLFTVIAQHSVEWVIKNPGFEQMHPKSHLLEEILSAKPNDKKTVYINVICDWNHRLMQGFFRRLILKGPAVLLDGLIKTALGPKHDWVIGCDAQSLYPKQAHQLKAFEINSIHGKYLDTSHTKKKNGRENFNTHDMLKRELLSGG